MLDYPGRPKATAGSLKGRREAEENQIGDNIRRIWPNIPGFEVGGRGLVSEESGQLLEGGKIKEVDFPLEASEVMQPRQHFKSNENYFRFPMFRTVR